ncbi:unnamed protein product, partial [Laminaria digitata]
ALALVQQPRRWTLRSVFYRRRRVMGLLRDEGLGFENARAEEGGWLLGFTGLGWTELSWGAASFTLAVEQYCQGCQGCSRVMTRPAGRVRRFSKPHGSGRVSCRQLNCFAGRVGSDRVHPDPTRP